MGKPKEKEQPKKPEETQKVDDWNSVSARAARKMMRCRVQLGTAQPFFGNLIMYLKVEEKLGLKYKTMATDGRHLFYDPEFVLSKTDEEIKWVITHEVMHCALKHFLRRQANPDYWNAAADYALNQLIADLPDTCGKFLPEALLDKKYEGWTAEMIYQYLLKNDIDLPPDYVNGKGGSGSTWRIGEVEDPPPLEGDGSGKGEKSDGEGGGKGNEGNEGNEGSDGGMKVIEGDLNDPEKLGDYWDEALKESLSKNAGNMPENFKRKLLKLLKPQVDWKNALKRFIISLGEKHKYDLPHRRFIGNDDIQWTRTQTKSTFDNMTIIADTSGSIGNKELTGMVTECYEIIKGFKPKEINLMWCDAALHLPVEKINKSNMHLFHSPRGGGGTDFRPPFKWIKENLMGKGNLGPIIYFTDGEGPFPKANEFGIPHYKDRVIWVIVGTKGNISDHIHIPFGTRLNLVL